MSALVAFAPVRLSVLNSKKTSVPSGSLFAIVDCRVPYDIEKTLTAKGFYVIKLEGDEKLSAAIASHTDIILFRHKNTLIGSKHYFTRHPAVLSELEKTGLDIRLSDADFTENYPGDAIFNALVIDNKLFCKADTVAPEILRYASEIGLETVRVKQGYPACTVLAIGDKFAVTSDRGMAKILESHGIEVMLTDISPNILLPPYENGFIGGCAGAFYKDIYLLGNASCLPIENQLKGAANEHGYRILSLSEKEKSLFDLGGIIFVDKCL